MEKVEGREGVSEREGAGEMSSCVVDRNPSFMGTCVATRTETYRDIWRHTKAYRDIQRHTEAYRGIRHT